MFEKLFALGTWSNLGEASKRSVAILATAARTPLVSTQRLIWPRCAELRSTIYLLALARKRDLAILAVILP